MPVCTLQNILPLLQQYVMSLNKLHFKPDEWLNTLRVVDKLNWNMRVKTAEKIYTILRQLQQPEYDLDTWHKAYSLFHAIGDWWTMGHTFSLYPEPIKVKVEELVSHFAKEETKQLPVILTMTSCKRFDLLSRTINSMLVHIKDLTSYVREWIVLDDNSSQADKDLMQATYPFIKFIFKTPEQKGHPQSMNMLRNMLLSSGAKYNFHVEDDWEFWYTDSYISKCIQVVEEDKTYGQALINFEYTEDEYTSQHIWNRDMFYSTSTSTTTPNSKVRYFVHEFYEGDRLKIEQNHLGAGSSMYWPHFSFRVGITKIEVYRKVGEYSTTDKHFEREYAYRYVKKEYKTAMLDCCYSTHIGRRTYERDTSKLNAYDLNNEQQFGTAPKTSEQADDLSRPPQSQSMATASLGPTNAVPHHQITDIKTYVINLQKRPERLGNFVKRNNCALTPFTVFEGVDGKKLQPNTKTQRMFETGDYHFRRGIVGCATSHIKIWSQFLKENSTYCIVLEDDVQLTTHFTMKLFSILHDYAGQFDVLMLHWNPYQHVPDKEQWDKKFTQPSAELWDIEKSMKWNMGSGAGYLLTRKAAKHLLAFIDKQGVPNAIDWVLMKQPELRIMYTKPKLVLVDCWQNNNTIQSDIQLDYDQVGFKSMEEWVKHDTDYWTKLTQTPIIQSKVLPDYKVARKSVVLVVSEEQVKVPISWCCKWYTIGKNVTVIVPDTYVKEEVYTKFVWGNERLNGVSI